MPVQYTSFREIAASWEGRPQTALLYEEGGHCSMTYAQLFDEISSRTKAAGDLRGEVLILAADHSPETVIRIFADVIAGADLILVDPQVPRQVSENLRAAILAAKTPDSGHAPQDPAASSSAEGAPEGRFFFFTSGTSQRSRAVILTPQSFTASAWSGQSMLPCSEADIILCLLPLSHVFGFVCGLLWGLTYGASVALGRGMRHLMDDCAYFHPTILPAVPTVIDALNRFHLFNDELRLILVGAAPCSERLTRLIQARGISIYLGYGLTETSSGIAISQSQEDPYALYPCPGADIRVEADGEVSVATPCMMQGYFGEPTPLVKEDDGQLRLYTGDLGRMDEKGRLYITGRKKDMLVLPDGTKIFCPEYEAELGAALGTSELAVIARGGRPVLVVESKAEADVVLLTVADFNRTHARSQQIAEVIYADDPLPRTAVGKLKRWELQQWLDQRPSPTRTRDTIYSVDESAGELRIREHWHSSHTE